MTNHTENLVARIVLMDCTREKAKRVFGGIKTRFRGVIGRVTEGKVRIGRPPKDVASFTLSATCSPEENGGCFDEACKAQLGIVDVPYSNIYRCRNCPKHRPS